MDLMQSLSGGNFTQSEGALSQQTQQQISVYQAQSVKITSEQKSKIITDLQEVETYISGNRTIVQNQLNLLSVSENIINKELQNYASDNTVIDLSQQITVDSSGVVKPVVSGDILNISYISYSEYYSNMNEFKYRLSVIVYEKEYLKQQLTVYNQQMQAIQAYIKALGG